MTEEKLSKKIVQAFKPAYHQVINQSNQHAGPATDSHFKLIIVSDNFNDMPLIKRHRAVNKLFNVELQQIHALAIHTYTLKEWQNKNQQAPKSPECHH